MLGNRSVPPATTMALGACSASRLSASSSERGATYRNWGSLSTSGALPVDRGDRYVGGGAIRHGPRRRDGDDARERVRRDVRRTDARGLALGTQLERAQHLLGSDRR